MNNTAAHQKLLDDVMFLFGSHPRIRIKNCKVGLAYPIGSSRPVYYGQKGEPDLQGVIAPLGHFFAIEIKTGLGKLSADQIKWRDIMILFGVSYCECHSIEQAQKFLEQLLNE